MMSLVICFVAKLDSAVPQAKSGKFMRRILKIQRKYLILLVILHTWIFY